MLGSAQRLGGVWREARSQLTEVLAGREGWILYKEMKAQEGLTEGMLPGLHFQLLAGSKRSRAMCAGNRLLPHAHGAKSGAK